MKVWIGAMMGDQELARKSVLVLAVHEWWITGAQQDFQKDYFFLRWKYAAVLDNIPGAAFEEVIISENTCVSCGLQGCVYACTKIILEGDKVTFGTSTFADSENKAADVIGHGLVHTVDDPFAGECPAYQWEADHATQTGIESCDPDYLQAVLDYLENNCE